MPDTFPVYSAFITLAIGLQLATFSALVGRARGRYQIKAPTMTGHPRFESTVRIHMNTLERLPIVLHALWIAAFTYGDVPAAGVGGLWMLTRVLYAIGYLHNPHAREAGAILGYVMEIGLLGLCMMGLLKLL